MADLGHDPHAGRKGVYLLALVSLAYTLILAAFLWQGYPAAAPSALPLASDEQYGVQVWYQVPLFFAATAACALILQLAARLTGSTVGFGVAFGRTSFAMTTPFALTTMLIEAVLAILLVAGLVEPLAVIDWLTGEGGWFPLLYQLVALVWIVILLGLAVRASVAGGWLTVAASAAVIAVVYAVPVGLFVR
jgi:hypothetical protein